MTYQENEQERITVIDQLREAEVQLYRARCDAWPAKDSIYTSDPARKVKVEQVTAEQQALVDSLRRQLAMYEDAAKWLTNKEK